MLADDGAGGVHDLARRLAQVAGQEALGVAVGDEADVVAVRLVRDREPAPRRLGADLGLGRVAEREHGAGELIRGEHGQHVGLVLAGIRGPVQDPVGNARVVAGADRVEAERHRAVEHRGELDLLVAAQARVRGAAGGVLGDEILHHVAVEALGHVPHVERDADDVGGPPRVPRVLQRAAAAGPGPVRRRVRRQRQMDAGHLVTRVHRTSRGRRGVHPARHRREHPKTTHRNKATHGGRPLLELPPARWVPYPCTSRFVCAFGGYSTRNCRQIELAATRALLRMREVTSGACVAPSAGRGHSFDEFVGYALVVARPGPTDALGGAGTA